MILIVRRLITIVAVQIYSMDEASSDLKHAMLTAFGAAVRNLRMQNGYSQEEFADHCGLDRTYIGGVERGERNIGLVNIAKIATALNIRVSALFLVVEENKK